MYAQTIRLYGIIKHMDILAKILSSKTRAAIFELLFVRDNPSLHIRDITRKCGFNVATVRQELEKLKNLDLLLALRDGNRLYYQANVENPLYKALCELTLKTSAVPDIIKNSLNRVIEQIQYAFIFGSFVNGDMTSQSDIDLFVIGDISSRKLSSVLKKTSIEIGREINYTVFSWYI